MLTKYHWLPAIVLIFATQAIAEPATTTLEVNEPELWGENTNVVQISRIYLAGQPDNVALEIARERGIDVIINLRDPAESEWDEQGAATNLGLDYYQVTVDAKAPVLNHAAMLRISEIIKANEESQILVHCSSGNRASAWLAYHLAVDHSMTTDESIAGARKAGLTKASIEQKLREYLDGVERSVPATD